MKKQYRLIILYAATACMVFALDASGDVYTNCVGIVGYSGGYTNLGAQTEPGPDGFDASLSITVDETNTLRPISYTVGIGHVWYEVTQDMVIDETFTSNATEFANAHTGYTGGAIPFEYGESVMLGFWLDANEDSVPNRGDRYGWAEMRRTGINISLVASAIESSGTGIKAGTVEAVPASAFLSLVATSDLTITGTVGAIYDVQSSQSLTTTNWTSLTNITLQASQTTVYLSDAITSTPVFFRAVGYK